MKRIGLFYLFGICLAGCSMSGSVVRMNVDYNYTLESITNQLTLINILRAKDGLPLHYTSGQRLTGSLTLQGTAGFNAQIKGSAPTNTTVVQDTDAPAGMTIQNTLTHAVASGGDIYMPSVGGQVTTGPSFDVSILDSQAFYQGVLSSLPFPTVEDFILQGYDNAWIMSLLVAELDLTENTPNTSNAPTFEIPNMPLQSSISSEAEDNEYKDQFASIVACYSLESAPPLPTVIAPLSRVQGSGKSGDFTLGDLSQLDGTKLDISSPLSADPEDDKLISVVRPSTNKQTPFLALLHQPRDCHGNTIPITSESGQPESLVLRPSNEAALETDNVATSLAVGREQLLFIRKGDTDQTTVPAKGSFIFRSTEGVIRALGNCLSEDEPTEKGNYVVCRDGDTVLFALHKGSAENALVSANVRGQSYYVDPNFYPRRSMDAIGLIERLVDLQKSAAATAGPATVPVQIVNP